MTEATRLFLERMVAEGRLPTKTVWCANSSPTMTPDKHDEHQVCIDQSAGYELRHPGKTWPCTCKCHR
jgi:hypothetical protein